jgi:hypothetical protein
MNTELSLILDPHLPWAVLAGRPLLALVGIAGARSGAPAACGGGRCSWACSWRRWRTRPCAGRSAKALDDIVLVVKDRSPSGRLAGRPEQLAAAEEEIRRRLGATPGVELREAELEGRAARAARCSRAWPTPWPRPTARGSAPSWR